LTEHITAINGSGGAHSYKTETFPLRELVGLELELGRIMGGAAGPGIDYLSGLFSIDKDGVHLAASSDAADKGTDSTKLGKAIAAIPAGIMEAGGYDFIAKILSRTSREVDIAGDGSVDFVRLADPHLSGDGATWMEHIYPGNLGEMHKAIAWVLCVNFSPFGRGPSWSLRGLWQELQSVIPMPSIMSTETTEQSNAGGSGTPQPTD
jgi:hypothetical protein